MLSQIINTVLDKLGLTSYVNNVFLSGFPIVLSLLLVWYANFTLNTGPRKVANEPAKKLRLIMILYNLVQIVLSCIIINGVSLCDFT